LLPSRYWELSPGGKAAGAWSWPLTSCRGQRMGGAIPPLPQYAFMAWRSVKAQGQLLIINCEPRTTGWEHWVYIIKTVATRVISEMSILVQDNEMSKNPI